MRSLIYLYNDQASSIVRHFEWYAGREFLPPLENAYTFVDPAIQWITKLASNYLDVVTLYFFLEVFFGLLGFTIFYKLLKRAQQPVALAGGFSLLFVTSLYYLGRVESKTPNLYPIFIFPLVVYLLSKKVNPLIIGAINLLTFYISSYYAFFSLIVIVSWYIWDYLIKVVKLRELFSTLLKYFLALLLPLVLLNGSLILENTFIFSKYSKDTTNETRTIYRAPEDYYSFSFRPWYFFIPPKSSLFFGNLSQVIYNKIQSTGYYLADDYADDEMAGSYMGWHLLVGLIIVAGLLLISKYRRKNYPVFKIVYENKEMICRSFFIIFIVLLISGPPSFTIGGHTIYTPSYLLYYIVPIFRVLTRWAVVIYMFVLLINSYLIQDLYNLMKQVWQKAVLLLGFFVLNFVIFAVNIPIVNLDNPPVEIAYFNNITEPGGQKYAVYPDGDYYSIFWILNHENYLLNPVDHVDQLAGFDSAEFSKYLITIEGIKDFKDKGGKYLIYYTDRVKDTPEKLARLTKVNPEIIEKPDVRSFFVTHFGEPVYDKDNVQIYKVK